MATLRETGLRQLAALVAVVGTGTFAAAADHLGFTQSAVSQQIRQLERAAGIALFDRPRGPRPAELTTAGRLVLDHARRVLARSDQLDDQLDLLRRGLAGQLALGTFQSASAELLPNMLVRMRAETPDVEVRLFETDDLDELVDGVLHDETDLAFTVDITDDPRLSIEMSATTRSSCSPRPVPRPGRPCTPTTSETSHSSDNPAPRPCSGWSTNDSSKSESLPTTRSASATMLQCRPWCEPGWDGR